MPTAMTNEAPKPPATTYSDTSDRGRLHKRSRSGCFTCRLRRKKCDEGHPSCSACTNLCLKCEYKRPSWWGSADQRRNQKERIKIKIKQTKMMERRGSLQGHMDRIRAGIISADSPLIAEYDFNRSSLGEPGDPFTSHIHTEAFPLGAYPPQYAPYEVDVRTERQTFVNDIPLRHDSSVSTFSAMGPPQLHNTLPNYHGDEWLQEDCFRQTEPSSFNSTIIPQGYGPTLPYFQTTSIPVEDHDRPLLEHFVEHVLRMIFPILEAHQQSAARTKVILSALETNKSYLHCCLSVSAIHLKTTVELEGEQIDHDIMRHRYEAISQLCQSLNRDTDHENILDATLAMIFFHCSVGAPDDSLPDIPWSDHFQAVSSLVNRLELSAATLPQPKPHIVSPFSMSLTSWIDILGATMLGKTPQFAHTYRSKHLTGTSSGLRELMGCDDRIMYLISEIACLDSLKSEGRMDELTVCHHVSALGTQLEHTESADNVLAHPYSVTGTIQPEQLTSNISTIFRLAARIYLCSLVPGFDRNEQSIVNLVSAITNALQFIPAGPFGFDRSLVWPLLMAASFSTPASSFRHVLAERAAALGEIGDFGAFGRMYRLVREVWRLSDDPEPPLDDSDKYDSQYSVMKQELPSSPGTGPSSAPTSVRYIKRQSVHWRDIMDRNGWRYLLM
ncbi:hypothetical protein N7447_000713 [Penicillium robsamsonii]|uniref:uncharacterized protein n=1 Tax=Penicillium robsamsonii TaxID=1792511 RepID=UPI0025472923|nr:uncharacterized protein N7447_000713 [Penicillium robsamsonii]KAJ5834687.1 hypothetical protein N7447_000713 [Penicillium robsamsonii]